MTKPRAAIGLPTPYAHVPRCEQGSPHRRVWRWGGLESVDAFSVAPDEGLPRFGLLPTEAHLAAIEGIGTALGAAGLCQREIAPNRYALYLAFEDARSAYAAAGLHTPPAPDDGALTDEEHTEPATVPLAGDDDLAIRGWQRVVMHDPFNADSRIGLALALLHYEHFHEARAVAWLVIDQHAETEPARRLLGVIERAQEGARLRLIASAEPLREALELSLPLANLITIEGLTLLEHLQQADWIEDLPMGLSGFRQALPLLEHLVKTRTTDASIQAGYGIVLLRIGRLDEAITALERAVTLDPSGTEFIAHLGLAHLAHGNAGRAIPLLEEATQRRPTSVAWAYLGLAHARSGRVDRAVEAFDRAIQSMAGRTPAWLFIARGEALLIRNKPLQAMRDFQAAERLAPMSPAALRGKALAAEGTIHQNEASHLLERARWVDPRNAMLTRAHGLLFLERNDPRRALPLLELSAQMLLEDVALLEVIETLRTPQETVPPRGGGAQLLHIDEAAERGMIEDLQRGAARFRERGESALERHALIALRELGALDRAGLARLAALEGKLPPPDDNPEGGASSAGGTPPTSAPPTSTPPASAQRDLQGAARFLGFADAEPIGPAAPLQILLQNEEESTMAPPGRQLELFLGLPGIAPAATPQARPAMR